MSTRAPTKAPEQPAAAPEPLHPRRPGLVVVGAALGAYVLLSVLALAALKAPGAMAAGNELPIARAVFAAVNTATLTGFPQSPGPNAYRMLGQVAVLVVTVASTVVTLVAGGMAVARVVRSPVSDAAIVRGAAAGVALAAAVGVATLLGDGRGVVAAAFGGASAFGNSGLFVGRLPDVAAWQTHLVLLPLAVLGGLGVPVLLDGWDACFGRRRATPYARAALALTAGAYVAGLGLLMLVQLGTPVTANLPTASAAAINSRSAGFPLGYAAGLTRLVQWVLILLMVVGPVSGGAGGGVKLTSLLAIGAGVRRALRGEVVGRAAGIAAVWLTAYAALVFLALLMLIAAQPQVPADRLLLLAVSAASNVGLTHEPVAMAGAPLVILSVTMMLGRILPIAVLWWQATTSNVEELPVG